MCTYFYQIYNVELTEWKKTTPVMLSVYWQKENKLIVVISNELKLKYNNYWKILQYICCENLEKSCSRSCNILQDNGPNLVRSYKIMTKGQI